MAYSLECDTRNPFKKATTKAAGIYTEKPQLPHLSSTFTVVLLCSKTTAFRAGATDGAKETSEGSGAFFTPPSTHHNRVLVLGAPKGTIYPHRVLSRMPTGSLPNQDTEEAEPKTHVSEEVFYVCHLW